MAKKHKNLENILIQWDGDLSHPNAGQKNQSIPASVNLGTWSGNPTTGYVACWDNGDYSINSCQIENMYAEDFDLTGVGYPYPEWGRYVTSGDANIWRFTHGRDDIYDWITDNLVLVDITWMVPNLPRGRTTNYTWGDVSFVIEIADGLGTGSRRSREARLHKFDKDTKKRLIHLICRVKGEKVYDEEKEVGDIQIKLEDADLVIERVLGKMRVENANVL